MKQIIQKYVSEWFYKLFESLKENTLQKIFLIFLSPILIYSLAKALVNFGWFTMLGYIIACIHGFSNIIKDPYRIVKWGLGYAIGATVTPLLFTLVWPEISKGTYVSIFSGVVILYVLFMIWWRSYELKKS